MDRLVRQCRRQILHGPDSSGIITLGGEDMNPVMTEDADVPALAVKGLNEATRKARKAGAIMVIRGGQLLKITQDVQVVVAPAVPGRKKVTVRSKRLKR